LLLRHLNEFAAWSVDLFRPSPRLRELATQTQLWMSIRGTPVGYALMGLKRWL